MGILSVKDGIHTVHGRIWREEMGQKSEGMKWKGSLGRRNRRGDKMERKFKGDERVKERRVQSTSLHA